VAVLLVGLLLVLPLLLLLPLCCCAFERALSGCSSARF